MFNTKSRYQSWNVILPILLICSFSTNAWCQQPLVVFLVRHAEKIDNSSNPPLSPEGKVRATTIARTLQDANIQFVHSTDYLRTKNTAAPIAAKNGLKTDLYDGGNLPSLVKKLKEKGGNHLVVGHSNTTPKLVELLGGDAVSPINDKEYDRLYLLNLLPNGDTNTVLIRFGNAYQPEFSK